MTGTPAREYHTSVLSSSHFVVTPLGTQKRRLLSSPSAFFVRSPRLRGPQTLIQVRSITHLLRIIISNDIGKGSRLPGTMQACTIGYRSPILPMNRFTRNGSYEYEYDGAHSCYPPLLVSSLPYPCRGYHFCHRTHEVLQIQGFLEKVRPPISAWAQGSAFDCEDVGLPSRHAGVGGVRADG